MQFEKPSIWWPLQQFFFGRIPYAQKKTACPLKALPVPRAAKEGEAVLCLIKTKFLYIVFTRDITPNKDTK